MSMHTESPDTGPGFTTTGVEKALAIVGLGAGVFFALVCFDLLSGGRLSAPLRAASTALEAVEDVIHDDAD